MTLSAIAAVSDAEFVVGTKDGGHMLFCSIAQLKVMGGMVLIGCNKIFQILEKSLNSPKILKFSPKSQKQTKSPKSHFFKNLQEFSKNSKFSKNLQILQKSSNFLQTFKNK
jgi:hypothetical protein